RRLGRSRRYRQRHHAFAGSRPSDLLQSKSGIIYSCAKSRVEGRCGTKRCHIRTLILGSQGEHVFLMMNKKETQFVHLVLEFYAENGRHTLPWRNTRDPYKILVSEVMLQQTQVDRVVPKYCAFIDRFPTVYVLAQARLSDVLVLWQGLGYNRR